jgi:hypothetical protein
MSGDMKYQNCERSLQLIKRSYGTSPKDARLLERMLRDAKDADFYLLEMQTAKPLARMRNLQPQQVDLISNLKKNVPQSAFRWLDSLEPEQVARIRIATNRSLDTVYEGDEWKRYAAGGAVMSGTVLAYANSHEAMPHTLEYEYDHLVRIIDTRDYCGERRIALAFEDYEQYFDKDRKGNDIEFFKPTGKVEVVPNFPSHSDWIGMGNGSLLGSPGQGRYVQRSKMAWVVNIFRSPSTIPEFDGAMRNDERARVTIYARRRNKEMFGLVMEAPAIRKNLDPPPRIPEEQPGLFDNKQNKPPPMRRGFAIRDMPKLKDAIAERVMFYIKDPAMLHADFTPDQEVGEDFARIASFDKEIQNSLRETVREIAGLLFLNFARWHTVEHFGLAFWKICDALGIPNAEYAVMKGKL